VESLAFLLLDMNTFDLDQIRESEKWIWFNRLARGKAEIKYTNHVSVAGLVDKVVLRYIILK
jgi:hypothetical protein